MIALAPGLFRTQFLNSGSYALAANAVTDYEETAVGQLKNAPAALHGNQPGDPAKLAKVVIELAATENPPLHLPVGLDALQAYRTNRDKMSAEIEGWAWKFTPTEI